MSVLHRLHLQFHAQAGSVPQQPSPQRTVLLGCGAEGSRDRILKARGALAGLQVVMQREARGARARRQRHQAPHERLWSPGRPQQVAVPPAQGLAQAGCGLQQQPEPVRAQGGHAQPAALCRKLPLVQARKGEQQRRLALLLLPLHACGTVQGLVVGQAKVARAKPHERSRGRRRGGGGCGAASSRRHCDRCLADGSTATCRRACCAPGATRGSAAAV